MANRTALEKCFCSQAAWQKWRLVQAPLYLSQVINFSPIKTPTEMMERAGSLTFHTRASCGTLQCVGWWFLQSPEAENVQERNASLPRWLLRLGNKKDLLGRSVPSFSRHLLVLAHQKTSENLPSNTTLLPSPYFLPLSHSPPPLRLPLPASLGRTLNRFLSFFFLFLHSLFQIDISWSLISTGEQWVHSITQSDTKKAPDLMNGKWETEWNK